MRKLSDRRKKTERREKIYTRDISTLRSKKFLEILANSHSFIWFGAAVWPRARVTFARSTRRVGRGATIFCLAYNYI